MRLSLLIHNYQMMAKIIYLIGTDGSGKTTLAKNYVKKMQSIGIKINYFYGRHVPILLLPLKYISRKYYYKKDTQFKNYKKYTTKKDEYRKSHPVVVRLYAAIWVLDYTLYYFVKVRWALLFTKLIIIDRYVADIVVNISIVTGYNKNQMIKLLSFLHYMFPKPDCSFFIEVSEDEAFSRKEDIPSIKYLMERKQKYYQLKTFYNFKILNGHLDPQQLVQKLHKEINDTNRK